MTESAIDVFHETASDPEAWRYKAHTLRTSAQSLWDSFFDVLKVSPADSRDEESRTEVLRRAVEHIHSAQLLYGLSTETGLKARIIQRDPDSIRFKERRDGDGKVVDLVIQKIGVKLGNDGHDLIKLAEAAGMTDHSIVFTAESDHIAMREILAYLTDCVRWHGRYPAPKKMSERYVPGAPIPSRILGHYMRDWLDPFLNVLLGDAEIPAENAD